MRCLNRNKAPVWHAQYSGQTEIIDELGHRTGQYRVKYGKPAKIMANVSAAKGESATRQFGNEESYDRVIVLDNPNTVIDENSVLWIGTEPRRDKSGNIAVDEKGDVLTPHNYIVRRVARGLDSASIAIGRVNVRD